MKAKNISWLLQVGVVRRAQSDSKQQVRMNLGMKCIRMNFYVWSWTPQILVGFRIMKWYIFQELTFFEILGGDLVLFGP